MRCYNHSKSHVIIYRTLYIKSPFNTHTHTHLMYLYKLRKEDGKHFIINYILLSAFSLVAAVAVLLAVEYNDTSYSVLQLKNT